MELHLFEDNLSDGQKVAFGNSVARAIYVTAGEVTVNGKVHSLDQGFVANGPLTLVAGAEAHRFGAGICLVRRPRHPLSNRSGNFQVTCRRICQEPAVFCGLTASRFHHRARQCCTPTRVRASVACVRAG